MGYFRDQHWIIEAEEKTLKKLRSEIINLIYQEFSVASPTIDYSTYVSPVLTGLANGYACLFLPADGSKEGWETSNCMDEVRDNIMIKVILHNAENPNDKISILETVVDEAEENPKSFWITNR